MCSHDRHTLYKPLLAHCSVSFINMLRIATITCVIVSCLGAVRADSTSSLDGRIAGGADANIADYPYMASLEVALNHKCGAVIINEDFVLTAASCVARILTNALAVRVGTNKTSEGGFVTNVFKVILNDGYTDEKAKNNIALVEVVVKLPLGPTIQPIPMTFNTAAEGAVATITGWDASTPHPRQLKVVQAFVINKDTCVEEHPGYSIGPKTICAGLTENDSASCLSESGGPVVVNGELVGLMTTFYGCASSNKPRVHTDLAYYRPWINVYTGL